MGEKFKPLNYLGPGDSYTVQYSYLNINDEVIDFEKHKVLVSWTKEEKSTKRIKATFFILEGYFKSYPRKIETAQQIKELKGAVEKFIKNRNNKW